VIIQVLRHKKEALYMTLFDDNAAPTGAQKEEMDKLASKSDLDGWDARTLAQRRLAFKLVASAGLSVALAEVLVVAALGDGRTS
jgi:hypothetical protein